MNLSCLLVLNLTRQRKCVRGNSTASTLGDGPEELTGLFHLHAAGLLQFIISMAP